MSEVDEALKVCDAMRGKGEWQTVPNEMLQVLAAEVRRRAPTEAAKPEAGLSERLPAWSCSGCGHIHFGEVGRCVGYCQDSSGKSCDAKACPCCGRFHYWTGSIDPKKLEAAKKAAQAPADGKED